MIPFAFAPSRRGGTGALVAIWALALVLLLLPAPAPAQTEPPPMRGRYRVTLNGFTVQRQTLDNFFQTDGKGDEIYFATYVAELDTLTSDIVKHWVVTSRAMGDQNGFPDRVRMGMNSSKGGIKTGDRYPLPSPQQRVGAIARDSLPMILWEGELIQGQRAVVLTPTVWEWDDNPELYAYWMVSRGSVMQQLVQPQVLLSVLDNYAYHPFDLGTPGFRVQTGLLPEFRDRPIGLEAGVPATGVGFVEPGQDNGKGPSNGGTNGRSATRSRSIVQEILSRLSSTGGPLFGAGSTDLVNRFVSVLESLLARPAPVSRAKGLATSPVTSLPWSPTISRDVKSRLRLHVDSMKKKTNGRAMKPMALMALTNSLRSVIRQFSARELYLFEKMLVLTPQSAEAALSGRPKPGIPPGAIDVVYVDHNPLQGRYILHLQVERIR
jgi:hypothetical protein